MPGKLSDFWLTVYKINIVMVQSFFKILNIQRFESLLHH